MMRFLPFARLDTLPLSAPAYTAAEMAPDESIDGLDEADAELADALGCMASGGLAGPDEAWRVSPDGTPIYGEALRTLLAHRDKRDSRYLQGLGVFHAFDGSPAVTRWRGIAANRGGLPAHALLRLGGHKVARALLATAQTNPEELGALLDGLEADFSPAALAHTARRLYELPDAAVNGVLGLGDDETGLEGYALIDADGSPAVAVGDVDGWYARYRRRRRRQPSGGIVTGTAAQWLNVGAVEDAGDDAHELYGLGDVGGWYTRYRKREKRRLKNFGKTVARNFKRGARMFGNFIKNSARIVGGLVTGDVNMIKRGVQGHADGAGDVANRVIRSIDRAVNKAKEIKKEIDPFANAANSGLKAAGIFGRGKMPDDGKPLNIQAKNATPELPPPEEPPKETPKESGGGGAMIVLALAALAAFALTGGKGKK